ncbi:hypothetical protein FB45DRAFT_864387 [Roridomyces roridus]|uniref:Uncharacterized protein n=1 Tax=Roridomyces roridus TaxID=1738132 RepID=A0AAD7C0P0_9AGAR|nr:hypothetical protein FB45DRAFT_864387 [Roridomyces roridus]
MDAFLSKAFPQALYCTEPLLVAFRCRPFTTQTLWVWLDIGSTGASVDDADSWRVPHIEVCISPSRSRLSNEYSENLGCSKMVKSGGRRLHWRVQSTIHRHGQYQGNYYHRSLDTTVGDPRPGAKFNSRSTEAGGKCFAATARSTSTIWTPWKPISTEEFGDAPGGTEPTHLTRTGTGESTEPFTWSCWISASGEWSIDFTALRTFSAIGMLDVQCWNPHIPAGFPGIELLDHIQYLSTRIHFVGVVFCVGSRHVARDAIEITSRRDRLFPSIRGSGYQTKSLTFDCRLFTLDSLLRLAPSAPFTRLLPQMCLNLQPTPSPAPVVLAGATTRPLSSMAAGPDSIPDSCRSLTPFILRPKGDNAEGSDTSSHRR